MLKIIICTLVIIAAVIIVRLPNRIIDTRSCKRNWVIVLTILASCLFIIDHDAAAVFLILALILGIIADRLHSDITQSSKHTKECNHERR